VAGERDRHSRHDQQHVEGIGKNGGFEHHLARVEQGRAGGQDRAPRGQAPAAEHCVHEQCRADAHQVLHRGDQQQAVERFQHAQEDRVPGGAGLAWGEMNPLGEIAEGVWGEHRRPEGQDREHPRQQRKSRHDGDQPVPRHRQASQGRARVSGCRVCASYAWVPGR
jgi:hypothetical protein